MRKFLATNLDQAPDGQWRWMINLPALAESLPEILRTCFGPGDAVSGPGALRRRRQARATSSPGRGGDPKAFS